MQWQSESLTLPAYSRGFHLITQDVVEAMPAIQTIQQGLLHLSLLHTSASLCINENADPSVRRDLESFCNHWVPEDTPYFVHTYEGQDDMPAHVKSALFGTQLTLSIEQGQLVLGTWQGIYLGEHRDNGGRRRIHMTLMGH